ncbi:MAG: hypothetical protein ACYCX4_00580, partial [Bacillota bacterium]
ERTNCLLKEYEMCHDRVKNLESTIWITSGVIGIGSIGSLISIMEKAGAIKTLVLGVFVIIWVWIWWFIAKRWWDIQHTTFMRMRHIENELGLFQQRYIRYLDQNGDEEQEKCYEENLENLNYKYLGEINYRMEYDNQYKNFHKGKVKGAIICLPRSVTIIWVIYIIYSMHDWIGGESIMQVIGNVQITWWGITIILGSVFIGGLGLGVLLGLILKGRK